MKKRTKQNRHRLLRRLLALTCALLLGLCLLPLPARAEEPETDVVRVGYYENEVFQEGAAEGAVKTGYAYEYYRKISEYTGWKYDYVYADYGELYQMLLDGEIDLLAGLAWRKDRTELLSYPEKPMGYESYIFIRHDADTDITSDPRTLNGRKIGVLDSAMVDVLNAYLREQSIKAEVLIYASHEKLYQDFDSHAYDVMVAEGDGTHWRRHAEVLFPFGATDYYLCVNKKRPDLLQELNDAQTSLTIEEPNYVKSLRTKYYPASVSARAFSDAEREWIETHETLRVGYLQNYLPYSDMDENGHATGIVTDMVPEILKALGISGVSVTYAGYKGYNAMIEAVNSGEIDIAFPVGGGLYYSEENGIYQSNPVVSASTELVYRGEFSEDTVRHFAVNQNNSMQYYYVRTNFPEAEITWYPSIDSCLRAVLAGEAGCTTLNGLRANDMLKNSRYNGLQLRQLTQSDDRSFGVRIGNEGLLKLINRGINVVGDDYAQNQAYRYVDGLYSYSFWDLVLDHIAAFTAAILAVTALVIFLLARDTRRTRLQIRDKEQARAALEEKNTELARSREALAETDDIIADAGFGIWHITLEEGKAPRMRGNGKMMELLGVAGQNLTEEETYDAWYSRIPPEDVPSVQKSVSEMLEGRLSENTYRWNHPQKGLIYVRCGGMMNLSEDKRQILRGYHADVTAVVQEELEQKKTLSDALIAAEHANRAKTAFLNNMSHDIRTPMNAIVGFTALAASHLDNREQVQDYLGKISVSSQHLLSLINDVLDMSRIESGKVTIEEAPVHLPEVIHDLRTIIQANVSAKHQDLFIDTQDVVHENIITDKLRLNQILLNILSNAIKFTPAGGTISFRVIEKPLQQNGWTGFEFRIKDNGIGMSESFRQTIFEAFTREKTSTVSGIQGTGLGMAITKNIVDMMNGTISVTSEEGKGSEFVVNIPCRISDSQPNMDKIPQLQGLRALVADDDTDSCLSVCAMLRDIGMRPDWTNYGREAVVRAKEAHEHGDEFKVYIIDWLMPDLNGIETVRRIRRIVGDDAPIIILTAYDWADVEEEAREAGVTAFCAKPIFLSELRRVLSEPFAAAAENTGETQKPDFTGKRLLLAEDNEMNQMIAVAILEGAGFAVEIANDGLQAVQKVSAAPEGTYDAVLMDIQMPAMDGYTAAKRIRSLPEKEKAEIPIIAVTANACEEDRKVALEAGMNGHLAKPYDVEKMMATLAEILHLSRG